MTEKDALKIKLHELDFALAELNLFLDSHPDSEKAAALTESYRKMKKDTIALYESKYGDYIVTKDDVPPAVPYKWIEGPWPWEKDFYSEDK